MLLNKRVKTFMILPLFVLLSIFVYSGNSVQIKEKHRRFEIIVSGFKDDMISTLNGRPRYATIWLNDVLIFKRTLSEESSERDDDFIVHDVAPEYAMEKYLGGYFNTNLTLSAVAFGKPLELRIKYSYLTDQNKEETIEDIRVPEIRCAANADLVRTYRGGRIKFDYLVSYWCRGYTGMGCSFDCDDGSENVPYECVYETGEKMCKDSQFNNPPDCNLYNTTCKNDPCKNGGKCVQLHHDIQYCNCPEGYIDDICSIFTCNPPCDGDFGTCIGPNQCQCADGRGGKLCEKAICGNFTCLNGGVCIVSKNQHGCSCQPNQFGGEKCEVKCDPVCVFGTCVEIDGKSSCQCFQGFDGEICDSAVPIPPPIYEKGYVSPKNQKLSYLGVSIGLIVFAILMFGVGSYIRNKKKTNLKIVKGTEVAIQTLQLAQQQTLVNNATMARLGVSQNY